MDTTRNHDSNYIFHAVLDGFHAQEPGTYCGEGDNRSRDVRGNRVFGLSVPQPGQAGGGSIGWAYASAGPLNEAKDLIEGLDLWGRSASYPW